MRVAIIGSRNAADLTLEQVLFQLPERLREIVSGGARGVDALAEQAAAARGVPFVKIEPDWARYGKSAPLVRNGEIVERADLVLAFWDYHSRGTADVIAKCIDRGVTCRIIGLDEFGANEIDRAD